MSEESFRVGKPPVNPGRRRRKPAAPAENALTKTNPPISETLPLDSLPSSISPIPDVAATQFTPAPTSLKPDADLRAHWRTKLALLSLIGRLTISDVKWVVRKLWKHKDFAVSALLLGATIWLGVSANNIVRLQTEVSAKIGQEQNQTAMLQGFVSATQGAGLEDERAQRMFELSIILYLELAKDPRYERLASSLPVPTGPQLGEILEGKSKADRDAILQLYGRAADVLAADATTVKTVDRGIVSVAIATFESRKRAEALLLDLGTTLPADLAARLYLIRNQRGLYLLLLGGFQTAEAATKSSEALGLSRRFPGVYNTQRRAWTEVCHFLASGEKPTCAEI